MRAALAAVLVLASALPAAAEPGVRAAEPILGFNFPMWWKDAYASPAAERGLREIKALGAGWVALTPTLYVKDRKDSEVLAIDKTASDDSLRAAIRRAHALGLKVALKPHVDSLAGGDRAWLSPSDPDRWFSTYRAHLLRYAALAREEGCELFVVGTELALLTEPDRWGRWKGLIGDARGVYPGPLTYAANWHSVETVGFWRELDYIGVDAYYPVLVGSRRRVMELELKAPAAALRALSLAYGRPVLFTEFGIASRKGAEREPWDWREKGDADPRVQELYLRAFLETFARRRWVAGFLHWAWDADASRGGLADRSMSVRGKPALAVLERLFAGGGAKTKGLPPAPDHSPAAARAVSAAESGTDALAQ